MDERNNHFDFDFAPIGQAIKKAREARGMTREQLSGIIGYAPRHIQAIENEGQYPSIELFIQLITMFYVSVDEYIVLLSLGMIREFHRRTKSNPPFIYHLENFGYMLGQTDIAENLIFAFAHFFGKFVT